MSTDAAAAEILDEIGREPMIPTPAVAFTDEKGRVVPVRVAEVIREAGHVELGQDGRLYRYLGGTYRADGERFAAQMVRELLGEGFRRRILDEVLAYLRSFQPQVTSEPQRRYLNTANGLLDLRTRELKSHSPQIVSTVQIPVSWNPEATCPEIEAFLAASLPTDTVDLVVEMIGYALYAGNPYRKAIMLLGPGGNGKSVLLRLIESLLGSPNCSHVPLQALGENRFAAANLFGRLANVCGDLDARAVKRTDLFKQITGGDPIFAEHKGRDPFSFTSIALPIFSANEAPISSDQSEAWFDRWLVVPMERRFAGTDEEDPHLSEKLAKASELEGLLVRAIDGLRTLMNRGRFDLPPSVAKAGERYRDTLDSARGFVSEMCIVEPEAWIQRAVLYRGYRRWCQESGRFPVAVERFNTHVRTTYPMRVSESTRRGTRGWQGLGLLAEGDDR